MTKYDELKVNGEVVNFEQTSLPVEQLANKNDTSAGILRDHWEGYNTSKGSFNGISASVSVFAVVLLATCMKTAGRAGVVTAAAGILSSISSVKTTVTWIRNDFRLLNAKKGQYERKSDNFFKNYKGKKIFSTSWLWKRKLK